MASRFPTSAARAGRSTFLVLAAAAVLSLVTAPSTAIAAPALLPPTDAVFTIECDDAGGTVPSLQLFGVDPATAVLTAIGTGDASAVDGNCAGSAATHPVTNTVYYIDQSRDNATLTIMNPTTGSSTVVAEFRFASDGTTTVGPDALAIDSAGRAYVVYQGELYSLDLATALITLIGDGDSGASNVYALAVHPVSGTIYGVSSNGPSALFTYDRVTGEATTVVSITQNRIFSMGFDSTGTLWVTNYIDLSGATELATVDVADWAASFSPVAGMTRAADVSDTDYYVQTLFLTSSAWPAGEGGEGGDGDTDGDTGSELAATGTSTEPAGLTAGAAGALLAAGIVVLTARRSRARA